MALVGFVWWASTGAADRQTDAAIRADLVALSARWRAGGMAALVPAIDARLEDDAGGTALYLVAGADGRILGGNLDAWPPPGAARTGWSEAEVVRDGLTVAARLAAVEPGDGVLLVVGRDITERRRLATLLGEALAWSLGLMVALALAGGWLVRRMLERRLAPIARSATRFAAGELSHRIPARADGDEFDRLALTLNAMLDRIVVLMAGVRDVSNAIAHDLRTPIARARARLEDALRDPADAARLRAGAARAIADLDGVVAIFEALLRIAEIEAGARRAAFRETDLAPLLEDLAETYAALGEPRGIRIETRLPARLCVHGDRDLLAQAVANLLDNAIKFSPDGATIILAGDVAAAAVRVAVTDSGPGIPTAERERARERFWRGEAARHSPGSGLGLALVEAVARLHGGRLELEDAGPGLVARLVIPTP